MFLSCLLIAVGENPDRPRPGRLWLHNLYRVHQRLCMAFPSAERIREDPEFLRAYTPEDFGAGHVHVNRGKDAGFLYRIDPQCGGRVVILVQSAAKPDWDYAFHNASDLLAAAPEMRAFEPSVEKGQRLRFRLAANPTRKIDTKTGPDGHRGHGRRVPVPTTGLHEWLARRAHPAGFSIDLDSLVVHPGYVYVEIPGSGGYRLRSARYEGLLVVADPDKFRDALIHGIGPGKGFGFGLLSVGRADSRS